MATETAKKGPAAEIREGNVRIAIWERDGAKGKYFTHGKPELSYRDDDGKWHNDVGSYSEFDSVDLIVAASRAKSEMKKLRRAAKKSAGETEDDTGE